MSKEQWQYTYNFLLFSRGVITLHHELTLLFLRSFLPARDTPQQPPRLSIPLRSCVLPCCHSLLLECSTKYLLYLTFIVSFSYSYSFPEEFREIRNLSLFVLPTHRSVCVCGCVCARARWSCVCGSSSKKTLSQVSWRRQLWVVVWPAQYTPGGGWRLPVDERTPLSLPLAAGYLHWFIPPINGWCLLNHLTFVTQ